jgi:hypothetical protein
VDVGEMMMDQQRSKKHREQYYFGYFKTSFYTSMENSSEGVFPVQIDRWIRGWERHASGESGIIAPMIWTLDYKTV